LRVFSRRLRYWLTPGQTKPYRAAIRAGADPEAALVAVAGPVLRWALDPSEPATEPAPEPTVTVDPMEPPEMPVAATPTPMPTAEPPTDIPHEWRGDWHERAGVMEHDGKVPRFQAERQATEDIRAMLPARLVTSCGRWGATA
jgi:hypothetical protein